MPKQELVVRPGPRCAMAEGEHRGSSRTTEDFMTARSWGQPEWAWQRRLCWLQDVGGCGHLGAYWQRRRRWM